jgi:hypothetical protein
MFKNLFKLDLRSLALARVLLGILAFFDLWRRIDDIDVFFSDAGILSRADLITNFELGWRMTLLNMNGSYSFALILLLVGMLASIFFTLGWRTRTSNFIIWVIITSFQARFPEGATSGGDMLIRIFFFWSIFLPMNARYSVDNAISETHHKTNEYLSVFSGTWVMQVFLLYFFTFFYKWSPVYHTDFDAVWFMLQLDIFTTPIGKWMGSHYGLTKVLSFASYALEIVGPMMLLIPFKRDFWRGLAVISFWCFHTGIGLTMHLGNFVPICIIIWVGLIPTAWWNFISAKLKSPAETFQDLYFNVHSEFSRKLGLVTKEMLFLNLRLLPSQTIKAPGLFEMEGESKNLLSNMLLTSRLRPVRKIGKLLGSDLGIYLSEVKETGEVSMGDINPTDVPASEKMKNFAETFFEVMGTDKVKLKLNRAEKGFGAFILALVIGWNIEGYVVNRDWYIGSPFDEIMFTLQLNQGWAMFAPHPQRSDGYWVMDGTLKNGKKWDALNNKEVNFDRPEDMYATYRSEDWRKFQDNLQGSRDDKYLLAFGKFLCREWNNKHYDGESLNTFKLVFMQEFTKGPKEPPSKVEKIQLWNHSCF